MVIFFRNEVRQAVVKHKGTSAERLAQGAVWGQQNPFSLVSLPLYHERQLCSSSPTSADLLFSMDLEAIPVLRSSYSTHSSTR